MADNSSGDKFLSKASKEIRDKINDESRLLDKVKREHEELTRAKKGYAEFYDTNLRKFFIECMQDFQVNQEDLADYICGNINEVYQNYVQIKKDALHEIKALNKYIDFAKQQINSNKRSLKFYRSQYFDSDFFNECLPLVELYEEKIRMYEKNISLTGDIISQLQRIADDLENWN